MKKNIARLRRARRTRSNIRRQGVARLSVHRTGQHIYAQVLTADGSRVIASASTLQKGVLEGNEGTKNVAAAAAVGKAVAQRALEAGVDTVAFDRSGYLYHGRVRALADAAREAGLKF